MQEAANQVVGFTPSMLWVFLAVTIALGIIAKLAMDLVIKYREIRKPKVSGEKSTQEKLRSDSDRLTTLEDIITQQQEELKLLLRGQMDVIHHLVDGNNTVALKDTQKDIEEFLLTGKVRKYAKGA